MYYLLQDCSDKAIFHAEDHARSVRKTLLCQICRMVGMTGVVVKARHHISY